MREQRTLLLVLIQKQLRSVNWGYSEISLDLVIHRLCTTFVLIWIFGINVIIESNKFNFKLFALLSKWRLWLFTLFPWENIFSKDHKTNFTTVFDFKHWEMCPRLQVNLNLNFKLNHCPFFAYKAVTYRFFLRQSAMFTFLTRKQQNQMGGKCVVWWSFYFL